MTARNVLFNWFSYLKNPSPRPFKDSGNRLKIFIVLFLFSLVANALLNTAGENPWIVNKLKIANIESHQQKIYDGGIWVGLLTAVIMAPIIEELLLRSYLTSFRGNNSLVPINIGLILIFLFHIRGYALLILIIPILLLSFIIDSIISKNKISNVKWLRWYSNNYRFYFYLSAISFGAIHILNFEVGYFIPGLTIFLVLPQIFGGLILGYIRTALGLRWSICFHALHNLFFLLLLFIHHGTK